MIQALRQEAEGLSYENLNSISEFNRLVESAIQIWETKYRNSYQGVNTIEYFSNNLKKFKEGAIEKIVDKKTFDSQKDLFLIHLDCLCKMLETGDPVYIR